MDFFDPLPASAPPRRRRRRKRRESHDARPTLLVPGYLNRDIVVAASDERAIVVRGVACYPSGFAFQLQTVNRYVPVLEHDSGFDEVPIYYGGRVNAAPERVLRFGIEYSNGKRASNLDEYAFHGRNAVKESGPHLQFGGGGGGGGDWTYDVWVWPLPPEGPVTFACEWPAYGIPETRKKLEGKVLRKAAERAKPVFRE